MVLGFRNSGFGSKFVHQSSGSEQRCSDFAILDPGVNSAATLLAIKSGVEKREPKFRERTIVLEFRNLEWSHQAVNQSSVREQ
jgi:hypothetical protein